MANDGLTLTGPNHCPNDDLVARAAMYRIIVENTIDLIIRYNNKRARIYVSPSALEMFGYTASEMMGRDATIMIHPDDFAIVDPQFKKVGPACPRLHLTFRVARKDGVYIWVEGQYRFLPEDGGSVAVLRDVTARKEAERLAAEANEKLEIANRLLKSLAQQDGLTGLANRRHLDQMLEEEFGRARRLELPLSLLMIDVDNFKAYNDRYGHLKGDGCLRTIGDILANTLRRPGDLAARYGGEEFVVLLPATDQNGAATVAERIRVAVVALQSEHQGSSYNIVTVSIGTSSMIPFGADQIPATLLDIADTALYQAKAAGRNTVRHGVIDAMAVTVDQP